jgi:hypothetical protein
MEANLSIEEIKQKVTDTFWDQVSLGNDYEMCLNVVLDYINETWDLNDEELELVTEDLPDSEEELVDMIADAEEDDTI